MFCSFLIRGHVLYLLRTLPNRHYAFYSNRIEFESIRWKHTILAPISIAKSRVVVGYLS